MSEEDKGAKSLYFEGSIDTVNSSNNINETKKDTNIYGTSNLNGSKRIGHIILLFFITVVILFILNAKINKEKDDKATMNTTTENNIK